MLSVNGVKFPRPFKYNVSIYDLDSSDSARSEAGILVRNRIRDGVTKIETSFHLRGSDASWVLEALQPDKVTVEYYDPRSTSYHTIQAYVSDRSNVMKVYMEGMPVQDILWEISFSLIEY